MFKMVGPTFYFLNNKDTKILFKTKRLTKVGQDQTIVETRGSNIRVNIVLFVYICIIMSLCFVNIKRIE